MAGLQVLQVYMAVQILFTPLSRCDTSLSCFRCSKISNVQSCDEIVQCQPGESCFIQRNNTSSDAVYTLGCKDIQQCPSTQSFILVGRDVENNYNGDCFECCQAHGCNKHLCEIKDNPWVHATQALSSNCSDKSADCAELDKYRKICSNISEAKILCKQLCALCYIVDGGWSSWGEWTECSRSCGLGIESRSRTCSNPYPVNRGDPCVGNNTQHESCFLQKCPDHGGWSDWEAWSSCSSQCGIGLKKRYRNCDNPLPSVYGHYCIGDPSEYSLCHGIDCWGSTTTQVPATSIPPVDCLDKLSDCATVHSTLGVCSNNEQARNLCKRYCGLCSIVDGVWSHWTKWSNCSANCGNGTMTRSRDCSNPRPENGGRDCVGITSEISACVLERCPVHGGWSVWSSWRVCSSTCGTGLTHRRRTCDNPIPSYSGNMCFGDPVEYNLCTMQTCSGASWSIWSLWGLCYSDTFPCEVGTQNRTRTCTIPSTGNGPQYCDGIPIMYRQCDARRSCFATFQSSIARVVFGRLEVFYNQTWGTVCDDYFDDIDAKVACQSMGYNNGWMIPNENVPSGTGQIWLDNVQCIGREQDLFHCRHNDPIGTNNCNHKEDVGVRCSMK